MSFSANKGDISGDRRWRGFGSEGGDGYFEGDVTVDGTSFLNGNVVIGGALTLSSTTVVDVSSSTIYTFADPVIYLNTTWTGVGNITESGLRVFRDALDVGRLMFMENGARTLNYWKAGIGADMLRIARIPDAMTDRHAMYWDDGAFAIASHPNIAFEATEAIFSVPIRNSISLATGVPYVRFVDAIGKTFSIENYVTAALEDSFQFQFADYTYGTIATTRGADFSADRMMRFRLRTPADSRVRYVFDGIANFGIDTDTAALLRSDTSTFRIEGATAVHLRAGTSGTSQLQVIAAEIDATVDLDMNTNDILNVGTLTVDAIDCDDLTFERMNVAVPAGIDPIPDVLGWTGGIVFGGTTYTETLAETTNLSQYEIKLAYTHVGIDAFATLYAPIYVGTDLGKIRAIHGVVRKMSAPGGTVTDVYGLPPNDIQVQDPFQLDAVFLTFPGELDDYHMLTINIVKKAGDWEVLATIMTQLP